VEIAHINFNSISLNLGTPNIVKNPKPQIVTSNQSSLLNFEYFLINKKIRDLINIKLDISNKKFIILELGIQVIVKEKKSL